MVTKLIALVSDAGIITTVLVLRAAAKFSSSSDLQKTTGQEFAGFAVDGKSSKSAEKGVSYGDDIRNREGFQTTFGFSCCRTVAGIHDSIQPDGSASDGSVVVEDVKEAEVKLELARMFVIKMSERPHHRH